jgi:hypothetical protein
LLLQSDRGANAKIATSKDDERDHRCAGRAPGSMNVHRSSALEKLASSLEMPLGFDRLAQLPVQRFAV